MRGQDARLAWLYRGYVRRLAARALVVPSGGVGARGTERAVRLLALVAARDEMRYLPGFLANVAPHVDGIVALDDGSADGSAELFASRPEVLELIRIPRQRPAWDEPGNHRRLVAAAQRHGAQWMVALDPDERVEREFRARTERVIRRGSRLGFSAFAVRLLELWDGPDRFRIDGVWGRKRPARLFRARPDHAFDLRPLHGVKAPLQGRMLGLFPLADLEVYHLRMIHRVDREARMRRYLALDPEERWQPGVGYRYLTDERGLRLRGVSRCRGFVE